MSLPVGRLGLGTVQFGHEYGISNRTGKVPPNAVAAILLSARSLGMSVLDTAIAYGESERVLGAVGLDGWRVVTKLPRAGEDACAEDEVQRAIAASLDRLGVRRLYGVLLHHSGDLLTDAGEAFYRGLLAEREAGRVERIGISIYDPSELDDLWPHYRIDLVQAPLNVLDRRLVRSGWMERLTQAGVAIHVRSLFLQGLLLMPPERRPRYFSRWTSAFERWERWCATEGYSPIEGCLAAVLGYDCIECAIVGVENVAQLEEIAGAATRVRAEAPIDLAIDGRELLEPWRWELQ